MTSLRIHNRAESQDIITKTIYEVVISQSVHARGWLLCTTVDVLVPTRGEAMMKYLRVKLSISHNVYVRIEMSLTDHLRGGSDLSSDTFIPNTPARNVKGRKMNVIQLRRHMLVLSSRD